MTKYIEIGCEFEPHIGVQAEPNLGHKDTEAMSNEWKKAAEVNVKDDEAGRKDRLRSFRRRVLDSGMDLRPGDDRQLLAMLRAGESDVDKAMKVAEAFLKYQQYCKGAIPTKIKEMLQDNSKLFVVLPNRDKYGRRVVVYRMWNAEKYPYQEIMKVFYIMCMTLAREPKTQIAGITLVGDMTGTTRRHVPSNMTDFRSWTDFMNGGCPVWFHKIHIVNAPTLFEWLWGFFKPFMSEHAKGNMVIHKKGQWDTLFKEVDKKILPTEFGGDAGPMDNSDHLAEILKLDEYFEVLASSSKK